MRPCARRSRHSFSRRNFRIQRMLSQDEMLHKASDNDPNLGFLLMEGDASQPLAAAMTLIEIRPHRWGWKAFEAPGVELVSTYNGGWRRPGPSSLPPAGDTLPMWAS